MPDGSKEEPIEIDTDAGTSVARHIKHEFWNVVTHPITTPSLYPNLQSFLEEVTPVVTKRVEPSQHFTFSTDPNQRVFQLTYDEQTEDYYIQRVSPWSDDAPKTRLPKPDPTVASLIADKLGITDTKKRIRNEINQLNPFPFLPGSSDDGK